MKHKTDSGTDLAKMQSIINDLHERCVHAEIELAEHQSREQLDDSYRLRAENAEQQARELQVAVNALEETLTSERDAHAMATEHLTNEVTNLRVLNNRQTQTIRALQHPPCTCQENHNACE
ncbi:hypothetical protein [Actinopolyspora halophila]|uniref:hypothetical protein n=1 Tax=Actinopolyspora halophila TaxID=1850 RepID=UPI00035E6E0C|nr:hypothetical protein [Actinopolyspora halophila]